MFFIINFEQLNVSQVRGLKEILKTWGEKYQEIHSVK